MKKSRCSARESNSIAWRTVLLFLLPIVPLKAYADPGSGALLWQIAGAFVLGSIYRVRKPVLRLIEWVRAKV